MKFAIGNCRERHEIRERDLDRAREEGEGSFSGFVIAVTVSCSGGVCGGGCGFLRSYRKWSDHEGLSSCYSDHLLYSSATVMADGVPFLLTSTLVRYIPPPSSLSSPSSSNGFFSQFDKWSTFLCEWSLFSISGLLGLSFWFYQFRFDYKYWSDYFHSI